jgi:hypothetical protein
MIYQITPDLVIQNIVAGNENREKKPDKIGYHQAFEFFTDKRCIEAGRGLQGNDISA